MTVESIITSIISSHWGMLVARFVLGFVFTLAGMSKVRARSEFEKMIANYNLLPPGEARLISIVLPWTELLIGALLLLGVFTPVATVIVAGLLVAFVGIAVMNAVRGKEAGCGCFGPRWHSKAGWLTVAARNMVLLALAGYLLIPRLTSSLAAPATSLTSMIVGGLVLAVAVSLGLPAAVDAEEEDKQQVQEVEADVDSGRRRLLRYATALSVGALGRVLLTPILIEASTKGPCYAYCTDWELVECINNYCWYSGQWENGARYERWCCELYCPQTGECGSLWQHEETTVCPSSVC